MTEKITTEMKLLQVKRRPEMKKVAPYLIGGGGFLRFGLNFLRIDELKQMNWNPDSVADGLNRLSELERIGEHCYPVYSREECRRDPGKKQVNLIHFPGSRPELPFVVLCAGGGYTCVCSAGEAYPVARILNELGYTAFVLNYRTGGSALLSRPLDDLAAALRFLRANRKTFGLQSEEYMVCGFSAGGHLTALWGTENHGFAHYGLPSPKALIPLYPPVSPILWGDPGKDRQTGAFYRILFGAGTDASILSDYDVLSHIGRDYPPTYLVCCRDDGTVSCENALCLQETLKARGIPTMLEAGEHGGHGFGEGRGTDVAGWIHRAVSFAENPTGT